MFGDNVGASTLRAWQAAGLSLAAGGLAAIRGPGAVAAAVALAPMVWAFGRLHRNAPSAGSTADLVAKVLGVRSACSPEWRSSWDTCYWPSVLRVARNCDGAVGGSRRRIGDHELVVAVCRSPWRSSPPP